MIKNVELKMVCIDQGMAGKKTRLLRAGRWGSLGMRL